MKINLNPDVVTVAVTRVDGGVTVLKIVTREYRPPTPDEIADGVTDRVPFNEREITPEVVEKTIAKYVISGVWGGPKAEWKTPVSWRFVPNDYVDENTDRYFRGAWKDSPGKNKPDVDMVKARNVHRDAMRFARGRLMDDLDVEYSRADEVNDLAKKREVAGKKQALRDVTNDPAIEAAQTPEQLKAVWPPILGENVVAKKFEGLRENDRKKMADMSSNKPVFDDLDRILKTVH